MRRLTTAELQTKAKMEMLMDKLKKKPKKSAEPLLVESIEESTITPVEAWPESPKTQTKPGFGMTIRFLLSLSCLVTDSCHCHFF